MGSCSYHGSSVRPCPQHPLGAGGAGLLRDPMMQIKLFLQTHSIGKVVIIPSTMEQNKIEEKANRLVSVLSMETIRNLRNTLIQAIIAKRKGEQHHPFIPHEENTNKKPLPLSSGVTCEYHFFSHYWTTIYLCSG